MAHDASNNNPKKEIVHALLGTVLLLVIIAGIAISAWLRPAGNHEPATAPATEKGRLLEETLKQVEAPKEGSAQAEASASAPAAASASATASAPATTSAAESAPASASQ